MGQTLVNEELIFVLTRQAQAFTMVKCQADEELLQESVNLSFRLA